MANNDILIHALAIHADSPGMVRARATVRLGQPSAGDRVRFEGTDRVERELEIVQVRRTGRLSTVILRGDAADLDRLVGGTYLYGEEHHT